MVWFHRRRPPNRRSPNTYIKFANICTRLQTAVDFSAEIVPDIAGIHAGVFWTAASGFKFAPVMRESLGNSMPS